MKALSTLLLLSSVVLLCSAAPALEPVTCSEESAAAAARLAMHEGNKHHDHGYKFRLLQGNASSIEKTDTGCTMELEMKLGETVCPTVSPKHFEDCEFRSESEGAVTASCTVKMTVEDSDAKVNSFTCTTQKALTGAELGMICPDCPTLIPLNDTEGLASVQAAVQQFNQNTSNQHYFILKEVGRISLGYINGLGMQYYSEILLQESNCPMHSRIVPSACLPLCPERATLAFCKATHSKSSGSIHLECEYYPPVHTGEESECLPAPTINVGPPVPPGPVVPVPGGLSPRPPSIPDLHPCHTNPGLEFHPICDWPHH